MKLLKLAAILLAILPSAALSDEYQDAISKAFRGFQILGPSEIKLNERMNPEIYNQVRAHPGLAVGRFNSDKVMDFAALIRGSQLIHIPENKADMAKALDYYEGYLVVCLGQAQGGYACTRMQTDPLRILVPHDSFLAKISPRQQHCLELKKIRPPKPKINPNLGFDPKAEPGTPSVNIKISTDAIGVFETSGVGDLIYIYQPNGMYLECVISD